MRWKKGQEFRKTPPMSQICEIHYKIGDVFHAAHLIQLKMYAGMKREQAKVPPNVYYFFMDWQTHPQGLHIYPPPEKDLIVRLRYQPPVREL